MRWDKLIMGLTIPFWLLAALGCQDEHWKLCLVIAWYHVGYILFWPKRSVNKPS